MQASEINKYDHLLVAFSGGKDSIAIVLDLIEKGVDLNKVELWHHDIDGREEGQGFMDWPVTIDYCRKFAAAFSLPIYYSWREGGFLREMLRNNGFTAPVHFEMPDGQLGKAGGVPRKQDKPSTRRMFPQVTASLSERWCSSSLKVDVMRRAIANDPRFLGKKTLILSGERAQESKARAKYATFEVHATLSNNKRTVHVSRPVHAWTEEQVWAIMERHSVNPHPAYQLGWGRTSCALCIFGGAGQWASARALFPARVARVAAFEREFGKTIDRELSVNQKADRGTPFAQLASPELVALAKSESFTAPVIVSNWTLPAGAFTGGSCGPE